MGKRQHGSDEQNPSNHSSAQSISTADDMSALPTQNRSKNSSLDQINRSSLSHDDKVSTNEKDNQGGNHTNATAGETTPVFSNNSILAILAAVLSLMCASACMAVSCFWRASDHMLKEWGAQDSENEALE